MIQKSDTIITIDENHKHEGTNLHWYEITKTE